jgi:hypothetical protein
LQVARHFEKRPEWKTVKSRKQAIAIGPSGARKALGRRANRTAQASKRASDPRSIAAQGDLLAFVRRFGESSFYVALNLGSEERTLDFPKGVSSGRIRLSTELEQEMETVEGRVDLRGNEAIIVQFA